MTATTSMAIRQGDRGPRLATARDVPSAGSLNHHSKVGPGPTGGGARPIAIAADGLDCTAEIEAEMDRA